MISPCRAPLFIQNKGEYAPHHKIQHFRFKCHYIKTFNKAMAHQQVKVYEKSA